MATSVKQIQAYAFGFKCKMNPWVPIVLHASSQFIMVMSLFFKTEFVLAWAWLGKIVRSNIRDVIGKSYLPSMLL